MDLNVGYAKNVKDTIDLVSKKYRDEVVINENAANRFIQLAGLVNYLCTDQNIKMVGSNIDPGAKEENWFEESSWFELFVTDLVFREGKEHPFFKVIGNADFCNLYIYEGDLVLRFGVKDMWVKLD